LEGNASEFYGSQGITILTRLRPQNENMAKKNYQRLDTEYTPNIENAGEEVELTLRGTNSNGTEVEITAFIKKYYLIGIVSRISEIVKNDASEAIRFAARIKEAVQ
jgi:hypothetical protein